MGIYGEVNIRAYCREHWEFEFNAPWYGKMRRPALETFLSGFEG